MGQQFLLENVSLVIPQPESGEAQRLPADVTVKIRCDGAWSAWVQVRPPYQAQESDKFLHAGIEHGGFHYPVTRHIPGVWINGFQGGFACHVDGIGTPPNRPEKPSVRQRVRKVGRRFSEHFSERFRRRGK
jgi:hypothetical protein